MPGRGEVARRVLGVEVEATGWGGPCSRGFSSRLGLGGML